MVLQRIVKQSSLFQRNRYTCNADNVMFLVHTDQDEYVVTIV